jgi:hypothetical protein
VPFRDDILRGLRLGAILLVLLFAGVAIYRIAHEPADPSPEARKPLPAATKPSKPAGAAAHDIWSGPAIPPPPPTHTTRRASGNNVASGQKPADPVVETPAPEPERHEESLAEASDPPKAPSAGAGEESPAPAETELTEEKPEGRPRRWVKAVGRFFHIVRQPQN